MPRTYLARLAATGLIVAAALATTATHAAAADSQASNAPLKVKPIVYRERRLANGLQVITVETHASPTVSVQVWYHVGSREDPPGRSGFAHLFEHMMFKSTLYLRAEQFDRLTEDVGGANNASTGDDVTEYHEVVPSNYLETLLWAEAERMMNLKVDEPTFKSERAVVEEEYRQRILASPYGRFFNGIAPASYLEHPYKRPGIGSIADLEASTLDDVVAFHTRHYRPDNATLIVAGDFDQKQLDGWIDKYFGVVPKPSAPLPAFEASEPPWPSDRTAQLTGPQVPLPAVAITWLAPPVTSTDAPALQVAAAVLAAGESSRLNQSLVYRQRIATSAGFSADLRVGPGLLIAYAIAAGGKSVSDVGAALLAEVTRLAATAPSAAELAKVKTQIVTSAFVSRQTPLGLASAIADAAVLEGNTARVNTDLEDLQRVSAGDVQRVLRRYVLGAHKVTIEYRQQEGAK
ncbi:MAG TPA: pitrilysin family protein [Caldimonas sp.]|nr:pitrilysin family protein [Caldimonas sp.]HEX4235648.1 pitrilysin family protein [Caldimonas sp.]